MQYTLTLTKGDIVRFTRKPLAWLTWSNQRDFQGETMPVLDQNITSLMLRGVILGWSDPKIVELCGGWMTNHSDPGDLESILASCFKKAHLRGDPVVARWHRLNDHKAAELAARSAKRPRPLILAYVEAYPFDEFTAKYLQTQFPLLKTNTITVALNRLVKDNILTRVSKGLFTLKAYVQQSLAELLELKDCQHRELQHRLSMNVPIRARNKELELQDHRYWCYCYGKYAKYHQFRSKGLPEPVPSKKERCLPTSKLSDAYCDTCQEIGERFPHYRDPVDVANEKFRAGLEMFGEIQPAA